MLPLFALLLVKAPDVLTARTLYEFDAFGDAARTPCCNAISLCLFCAKQRSCAAHQTPS